MAIMDFSNGTCSWLSAKLANFAAVSLAICKFKFKLCHLIKATNEEMILAVIVCNQEIAINNNVYYYNQTKYN